MKEINFHPTFRRRIWKILCKSIFLIQNTIAKISGEKVERNLGKDTIDGEEKERIDKATQCNHMRIPVSDS